MPNSSLSVDHARKVHRVYLLLLISYTLLIVWGSLASHQGANGIQSTLSDLGFLTWPRYNPKTDLITNLLIYIPAGFLSFKLLKLRLPLVPSIVISMGFGCGLSFGMEALQSLIPGRVSSVLDLILNSISTLFGVIAGVLTRRSSGFYQRMKILSAERFRTGAVNELGLVAILLWLISQWFPFLPSLDIGHLAKSVRPLIDSVLHLQLDAAYRVPVYVLNIIALGCILQAVQYQGNRIRLLATVIAVALVGRIFIVSNQLSPESVIGSLAGIVAVWLLAKKQRLDASTGMIAIVFSLIIDKTAGLSGFSLQAGNFIWAPFSGYTNYMRGLSDIIDGIWPYWTFCYFATVRNPDSGPGLLVSGAIFLLLFATGLEVLQLYQHDRTADITDILTAVLGWLLAWAFYRLRSHADMERN